MNMNGKPCGSRVFGPKKREDVNFLVNKPLIFSNEVLDPQDIKGYPSFFLPKKPKTSHF